MAFKDIIILLPCRSLEDLSLDWGADDAEQLLSAWSAPFHPAIMGTAGAAPRWVSAEQPPEGEELAETLILLPHPSESLLPDGWVKAAVGAGACVIRDFSDRDRAVAAILDELDGGPGDGGPVGVDPDLVADFHALGFCQFQVELVTRQLRYMSSLDQDQFGREAVAAAEAALKGDLPDARERLQSAFDLLTEAREYFYPVEAYFLDLTLVASTTLGGSLRGELAGKTPCNLLISGEVVRQMARREPETLAALKAALARDSVSIVGGEYDEPQIPLLTPESILAGFQRGLAAYREHAGHRPMVFGRRRFGLSPVLPQVLDKLGFLGALHFTLDDGRFPTGAQSKIRWEGIDHTILDALARVPLDASRPDSFLRLAENLGEVMDLDHTATVVFAHWPGRTSRWYDALKRMADYAPVLGRFISIDEYFRDTEGAGQTVRYEPDQYRGPYLDQAVASGQVDPISRWVRYHHRRAAADALQGLNVLVEMLASVTGRGRAIPDQTTEDLLREIEDSVRAEIDPPADLDGRLRCRLDEAARLAAELLPRRNAEPERGCLVLNPTSFDVCSDRIHAVHHDAQQDGPDESGHYEDGPDESGHYEQEWSLGKQVHVPAMGFTWIGPGRESPREPDEPARRWKWKKKPEEPPMAEAGERYVLRNEYFEATIHPVTGAIRAIHDYHSRDNRLGQQLALRLPPPGSSRQDAHSESDQELYYSLMAADEMSVTSTGPAVGEIVSRGWLVDREGNRLAGFVQTMRVRRGSRVLELEIELEPDRSPEPGAWDSYYAVRFAWNDATANVYRGVGLASVPSDGVRLEAPQFIDIRSGDVRTTILTAGLPCHRRRGLRKLDSLLVVHGETARRFRLGIGIDLRHPASAALDFLTPKTVVNQTAAGPATPSGWFFHVGARNVMATHWEPTWDDGRVTGFRARLLETEGRRGRFGLRSFRPIASAHTTDFQGERTGQLHVENDDRIAIEIGPHRWIEIEARFKAVPM